MLCFCVCFLATAAISARSSRFIASYASPLIKDHGYLLHPRSIDRRPYSIRGRLLSIIVQIIQPLWLTGIRFISSPGRMHGNFGPLLRFILRYWQKQFLVTFSSGPEAALGPKRDAVGQRVFSTLVSHAREHGKRLQRPHAAQRHLRPRRYVRWEATRVWRVVPSSSGRATRASTTPRGGGLLFSRRDDSTPRRPDVLPRISAAQWREPFCSGHHAALHLQQGLPCSAHP